MESEAEPRELQRSPSTLSINTGSKQLLRLKRSLAFMRSKSVENFFQRSNSDARLPSDITDEAPPPSPPLLPRSPLPSDSPKPPLSPSQLVQQKPRPAQTHCFQDHVFRRPTSCQLCKHIIVGHVKSRLISGALQNSRSNHAGMFKRNFSTPSITCDQSASKEAQTTPGGEGGEEKDEVEIETDKRTNNDTESSLPNPESSKTEVEDVIKVPRFHPIHTYVALYKFLPQEQNDLELRPGDRVQVTDDSNEDWWKGKSGDRVGFFPANFVQRVRPGESVWRVTQGVHGNRQMGYMTVKEDQICVGKKEDSEGFVKLCSGKKRGLVPTHSLEEI
ncbi:hypothetical protein KOW79_019714 [Hemibagrus wyckioides]|uniref:SH3 domain-containing protein n=1 Tax=Hemibagrus wyckioides TaxID=337641 RepID=A0A9D3N771_9TELE|nr:hypothetical protein KOW79_019714 [Hemibagrus wyckioides]